MCLLCNVFAGYCEINLSIYLSHVEVTAQLKRPGIGQNMSCALELLHFETLPS